MIWGFKFTGNRFMSLLVIITEPIIHVKSNKKKTANLHQYTEKKNYNLYIII
jgi:hypothetical protein